jgi:hypothetical protein
MSHEIKPYLLKPPAQPISPPRTLPAPETPHFGVISIEPTGSPFSFSFPLLFLEILNRLVNHQRNKVTPYLLINLTPLKPNFLFEIKLTTPISTRRTMNKIIHNLFSPPEVE